MSDKSVFRPAERSAQFQLRVRVFGHVPWFIRTMLIIPRVDANKLRLREHIFHFHHHSLSQSLEKLLPVIVPFRSTTSEISRNPDAIFSTRIHELFSLEELTVGAPRPSGQHPI
jgi:hypothetical protein